ncbi:hypothetical protein ATANTOWER_022102 [Ataeniobius toweri]|uniref:Secreted protein n=1 Tax=Ataeniobius toweri TaxID=208326 RepID=A0ABU7A7Z9_9TELE|nr:hypothetical protein [Ataeniobius toweri]
MGARTHFLNLLCLSGCAADLRGTARQGSSGFCTTRQGSTVVPALQSSTAGFRVAVLLSSCSEGPPTLLDRPLGDPPGLWVSPGRPPSRSPEL